MAENEIIINKHSYNYVESNIYLELSKQRDSNDRFRWISQRKERSWLDIELIKKVYKTCCRGVSTIKRIF